MSTNTKQITIRPGRAADTFEVVSPVSLETIFAANTYDNILASLMAAYTNVPEGTWRKALDDAIVRQGVTIAVDTAARTHVPYEFGPLKPDDQLLP